MFITDIRYSEASLSSSVTVAKCDFVSAHRKGNHRSGSSSECHKHLSQKEICLCCLSVHTSTDLQNIHLFFFTDHITSEPMLSRPELCGNELHRWRLPSCSLQILLAASKRDGEAATALSSWRCATTNQCNAPLGKSRLMKQKLSFQVWHTLTEYSSPRKCHRASSWNDEKICTRVQLTAASQVM